MPAASYAVYLRRFQRERNTACCIPVVQSKNIRLENSGECFLFTSNHHHFAAMTPEQKQSDALWWGDSANRSKLVCGGGRTRGNTDAPPPARKTASRPRSGCLRSARKVVEKWLFCQHALSTRWQTKGASNLLCDLKEHKSTHSEVPLFSPRKTQRRKTDSQTSKRLVERAGKGGVADLRNQASRRSRVKTTDSKQPGAHTSSRVEAQLSGTPPTDPSTSPS